MAQRVNFKELKRTVSILSLVEYYGVELKRSGDTLRGQCPIHGGENESSFSVWPEAGSFHCFSCEEKGNIFDFVMAMEDITEVREVALWIDKRFGNTPRSSNKGGKSRKTSNLPPNDETVLKNAPMASDFEAKYRKDLGEPHHDCFNYATLKHFECGSASKGVHRGKPVTPIRNEHGKLLCYAGLDEKGIWSMPKGYHPTGDLYNLQNTRGANSLIVVSHICDVWTLYEAGWTNVVATVGLSLSDVQLESLKALYPKHMKVLLLAEPDFALVNAIDGLGRGFYLKFIKLSQPLYLDAEIPF